MPIRPENRKLYPPNWAEISNRIRFGRARGHCERCGAEHAKPHPRTGSLVVLTVAHLDHDPTHSTDDNLAALCQACHLEHDRPTRILRVYGRWQPKLPGLEDSP